jgi:hypothetical protein
VPRIAARYLAVLPLFAVLAGSADAYDPIVVKQGWRQIAFDRDGACAGEVRTNGKFALINAAGLGAGAEGRYLVTNADMKPIDWTITAGPDGEWVRYYVPFLPGKEAGTVQVTISTRRCSLSLAFAWDTYNPANDWASIRAMGGESIAQRSSTRP